MSIDDYNPFDNFVPDLRPGGITYTTIKKQTATEFVAQQKISDQIVKDFGKSFDAEIFKLMTGGTVPSAQYGMLSSSTGICVDCGQPYLRRVPRDLLATHCSSCEDAQKEAAGLK